MARGHIETMGVSKYLVGVGIEQWEWQLSKQGSCWADNSVFSPSATTKYVSIYTWEDYAINLW